MFFGLSFGFVLLWSFGLGFSDCVESVTTELVSLHYCNRKKLSEHNLDVPDCYQTRNSG